MRMEDIPEGAWGRQRFLTSPMEEMVMSITEIIILVVVLVFLFGGGGYWWSRRG